MTEAELVDQMAVEMQRCETPIEIVLRPLSAFQLAGLLQLALRHPGVDGSAARTGRTFIDHVRGYFGDQRAPAVLEVLRRGDDPREDR
jgi:hypothetical protein